MSKFIDKKLKEFDELNKGCYEKMMVPLCLEEGQMETIKSFLKSALMEQIEEVEKILGDTISIESLETKKELDEVYRKLEVIKGQNNN